MFFFYSDWSEGAEEFSKDALVECRKRVQCYLWVTVVCFLSSLERKIIPSVYLVTQQALGFVLRLLRRITTFIAAIK